MPGPWLTVVTVVKDDPEGLARTLASLAHQRLDPNALAFFAGGAADEITVRWNREAFKLLSQLFQMTVTEVPRAGVPSITIAK